ncbi:MAG TPA: 4-(cytidine 5'-diphospho)-2-C-methyl-D-erythritol kinase [Peptococcaceae bacterium]|nr:4-(cytidine 5'-diphospho)-2-C-methyl-D-erythritol kinase [Peptococcaceae bacterium]
MRKIVLKAFGKINLTLDVLGKREDGYHELETLFRGIHLYDIVSLERRERGIQLECDDEELSAGPDNLAYKAAELLMRDFPQVTGVTIQLVKRIPVSAGLAGGSTDAAAVLIGVNRLFGLELTKEQLSVYAAAIGSDVPFCLYPLSAVGRGRGELLTEASEGPAMWIVLVKPPFGLSTGEIYEHLENVDIAQRPNLEEVLRGMEEKDLPRIYQNMGNVLEYSAFDLQPRLRDWERDLSVLRPDRVMMTGSGPTLVAYFSDEEGARRLAAQWTQPRWDVLLSRTLSKAEVEDRMIFFEQVESEGA